MRDFITKNYRVGVAVGFMVGVIEL